MPTDPQYHEYWMFVIKFLFSGWAIGGVFMLLWAWSITKL